MKRTAPAFGYDNQTCGLRYLGTITCECVGEWVDGKKRVKSWVMVGDDNTLQFSLARSNNKFFFVLEAVD